jgi:hypothetical protein
MERTAPQVGVAIVRRPVNDVAAIRNAIGELASAPLGGLVLIPDVFTARFEDLISELAIRGNVPTIAAVDHYARRGCLTISALPLSHVPTTRKRPGFRWRRVLRGAGMKEVAVPGTLEV